MNNLDFNTNCIGNDEVGVGDFFGPLVVVSCYIEPKNIEKYPNVFNEVNDSKKLDDSKVIKLFKELNDKVIYKAVVISNTKYNNLYSKYNNSHVLKALGHNAALLEIIKTNNLENEKIIIDKFVDSKKYFEYLKDQDNIVKNNIEFIPKADGLFLSVACASIIARFFYLEEIKKLEKKFNIKLPLGASNDVKKLVKEYKNIFGKKSSEFIKLHFNDNIK